MSTDPPPHTRDAEDTAECIRERGGAPGWDLRGHHSPISSAGGTSTAPRPGAQQQVASGAGGGWEEERARGASLTLFDPHSHLRRMVYSQFQTGTVCREWSQSWGEVEWPLP